MSRVLAFLGRMPMSLRVALVVSPLIVAAQVLTVILIRGGPQFAMSHHGLPPPDAMFGTQRLPRGDGPPQMPLEGFWPPLHLPPIRPMIATFGVTALLVWVSALWVTRPLARLADAAEALGRDMDHAALEDRGPPEVRRAARAFNDMQDRLRRFVRGRADALLAMSHDLKTPITRLKLRIELLPDEQRMGLTDDLDLLQSRVEQALGFMRGVHRDEPMRPVVLDALAAKVIEHHQDLGAQVELKGATTTPLFCRPAQLERAIANLVENAVHHAGGATVEIGEDARTTWVAVLDRGPGVPQHFLERLTEPFFRVEGSRNRDSGGAGLGLAIVKDIVESHGGQLRIVNRSEGGLEARIELPRH